MHRPSAPRRPIATLTAALGVWIIATGCSQATTAANHTDNAVQVIGPAAGGGQTSTTIRYTTDLNAATVALDVPVDVAWRRVQLVYAELKIPVTAIDSMQHAIGARNVRVVNKLAGARLGALFDCGLTSFGTSRADSYTLYATVMTSVTPAPAGSSGSTAQTVVSATAEANDSPSGRIQCGSKGALESRIAQALTAP